MSTRVWWGWGSDGEISDVYPTDVSGSCSPPQLCTLIKSRVRSSGTSCQICPVRGGFVPGGGNGNLCL